MNYNIEMGISTKEIGRYVESLACDYLKEKFDKVFWKSKVDWSYPYDFVVEDNGTKKIIEVKSHRQVSRKKLKRILKFASKKNIEEKNIFVLVYDEKKNDFEQLNIFEACPRYPLYRMLCEKDCEKDYRKKRMRRINSKPRTVSMELRVWCEVQEYQNSKAFKGISDALEELVIKGLKVK